MIPRHALIRDLAALLVGCAVVFFIDVTTPATLAASVAYPGLVLLALRDNHSRLAVATAGVASILTLTALAIDGSLSWHLSDALLTAIFTLTLTWMTALLGSQRPTVRASETRISRRPASTEQIESQANLIRAVAVDTQTMPLGNATKMTDEERQTLANWLASR